MIQPDVTNTIYIEIISGLFLNSIAILISVFAYKTANEARKIQEKQNNIQIIQAASKLVDLIRNDLTVMYDLYKQIGTENDLDILNANDYICCLYSNKKINNKDYNYLLVLFKKIEIIKNYYNSPNITEKERNINEFMSTYFINNGIDKNQDLEKILDKIAKIIE